MPARGHKEEIYRLKDSKVIPETPLKITSAKKGFRHREM